MYRLHTATMSHNYLYILRTAMTLYNHLCIDYIQPQCYIIICTYYTWPWCCMIICTYCTQPWHFIIIWTCYVQPWCCTIICTFHTQTLGSAATHAKALRAIPLTYTPRYAHHHTVGTAALGLRLASLTTLQSKTSSLLHYPRKIKFIHSFIHSFSLS